MPVTFYHVMHLVSLFCLFGATFAAFAAPEPERRKFSLAASGIASLLVLVSGFGLLAKLQVGFPIWIVVKLICWFVVSGLAGIAFRKRELVRPLTLLTVALSLIAVVMVYCRPFVQLV